MTWDPLRVLIWVQHLWGIGHVARSLVIADALVKQGVRTSIVLGGPPTGLVIPDGVDLHQLPPVKAPDTSYRALVDLEGRLVTPSLLAARRERLLAIAESIRPQVIVTELFPFGRRKLSGEVLALLEAAHARTPRTLILSSVRDILEDPGDGARRAQQRARFERYYDAVLVHGDPALVRLEDSLAGAETLPRPVVYTGLVAPAVSVPEGPRQGVIVSAGGGREADTLIEAALNAQARGAARNHPWRILLGSQTGLETLSQWRAKAPEGVEIDQMCPDLPHLLASAALSVSRAGYNTVAEGLAARVPMILVPHEAPGQSEQTARATALARRGWARLLRQGTLTGETLAQAIHDGLNTPPKPASDIDLSGAETTARWILTAHHRKARGEALS